MRSWARYSAGEREGFAAALIRVSFRQGRTGRDVSGIIPDRGRGCYRGSTGCGSNVGIAASRSANTWGTAIFGRDYLDFQDETEWPKPDPKVRCWLSFRQSPKFR